MASRNDFGEKFYRLLQEIPADYSLQDWQHLYGQALFGMGLTILDKFSGEFVGLGPKPPPAGSPSKGPPAWAAGGGGGKGYNPNRVIPCELACFILKTQASASEMQKKRKR